MILLFIIESNEDHEKTHLKAYHCRTHIRPCSLERRLGIPFLCLLCSHIYTVA